MKIVIDLPEEMICRFKHEGEQKYYDYHTVIKACVNGTPLPKGHGDLVDRDAVYHMYECSDLDYTMINALEDAPTVIEADKEEEK